MATRNADRSANKNTFEGVKSLRDLVSQLMNEQNNPKPVKQFTDIVVRDSPDTQTIILPEGMTTEQGIEWLGTWEGQQKKMVNINIVVEAFPLDGALAFSRVLKATFGWTDLRNTPSFWSEGLPQVIDVAVGPGKFEQAHWGRVTIPGVEGHLDMSAEKRGKRLLFKIAGKIPRKHEAMIKELGEAVKKDVRENSIYRGKAIRINFRDEDGNSKDWDFNDNPIFIDTKKIDPTELVLPAKTRKLVEATLFYPIEFTQQCREHQIPLKRGTNLEGPFGVGKTMIANVTAKKCEDNGWTFIYVEDVRDLDQALALAELYMPAVVFGEDLDQAIGMERDEEVNRILNILDGVATKKVEIMTVVTTNNVGNINQAMLRPGRIDTVIPVRAPDREAAVRLIRVYGRGLVTGSDEAIAAAIEPLVSVECNAAFYRECIERAKLSAISHLEMGQSMVIEPADIAYAALTQAEHLELLKPRVNTTEPAMETFGRGVGKGIGKALMKSSAFEGNGSQEHAALTDSK